MLLPELPRLGCAMTKPSKEALELVWTIGRHRAGLLAERHTSWTPEVSADWNRRFDEGQISDARALDAFAAQVRAQERDMCEQIALHTRDEHRARDAVAQAAGDIETSALELSKAQAANEVAQAIRERTKLCAMLTTAIYGRQQ